MGGGIVGCTKERPITVGSKNFTEQVILGEIVAQHLEHRLGRRVDRKLNLGGTMLAHQALVQRRHRPLSRVHGDCADGHLEITARRSDPAAATALVRAEYQARFGVEWMDPLGFNNTFAMVIRGEEARKNKITTLSDAAQNSPGWNLGVGYEFQQRPDGLAGLLKTYHLPVEGSPKTMDLGLLYKALEQGQVSMVAGNATDGQLSVLDVVVLRDDKRYFPPYDCASWPCGAKVLRTNPPLRQALTELAGLFTDRDHAQVELSGGRRTSPCAGGGRAVLREPGCFANRRSAGSPQTPIPVSIHCASHRNPVRRARPGMSSTRNLWQASVQIVSPSLNVQIKSAAGIDTVWVSCRAEMHFDATIHVLIAALVFEVSADENLRRVPG